MTIAPPTANRAPVVVQAFADSGTATITLTAKDPGGLTASHGFSVTVTDRRDHSDTPSGATVIALSANFQGRIDSPNDVDYFRLRVDSPGTLTIRTTGNAAPDIAVFGAGIEVPGVSGSWVGNITQDILDSGNDLLVRFSGGNVGGDYKHHARANVASCHAGPGGVEAGARSARSCRPAPATSP
ncbi:MAG: hypothetical protein OXJ90_16870 [Spirochaetaceae bacterium]|nr:hypothetical protein [Spirochaetaceae bacterium]